MFQLLATSPPFSANLLKVCCGSASFFVIYTVTWNIATIFNLCPQSRDPCWKLFPGWHKGGGDALASRCYTGPQVFRDNRGSFFWQLLKIQLLSHSEVHTKSVCNLPVPLPHLPLPLPHLHRLLPLIASLTEQVAFC